jgi:heme o synthase
MKKITETIKRYGALCKMKISFFSALSAATGYFLASLKFGSGMLFVAVEIFILSCGASALNQYQEREIDARMKRTRKRPLPLGIIMPNRAFLFSGMLVILGLSIMFFIGNTIDFLFGLFAVIWYNGLYTFLKKKTAFAVIPGALIGAIPPAIGWVSGGGALNDPRLFALCFLFFMWQVPHFWLLMVTHGKEYEEAGLPSLSKVFSRTQMMRIISQWILATVVSCLFLLFHGLVHFYLTAISLFGGSLWFAWKGIGFARIRPVDERSSMVLFRKINGYMLAVLTILCLDGMTFSMIGCGLKSFIE